MPDPDRKVGYWRVILAAILVFITLFLLVGLIVGKLTGGLTDDGFKLEGWPALLLFVAMIGYSSSADGSAERSGGVSWVLRRRCA